jgi:hypothetical protein
MRNYLTASCINARAFSETLGFRNADRQRASQDRLILRIKYTSFFSIKGVDK